MPQAQSTWKRARALSGRSHCPRRPPGRSLAEPSRLQRPRRIARQRGLHELSAHELRQGAERLGVDFDEHLGIVIAALTERQEELIGGGKA